MTLFDALDASMPGSKGSQVATNTARNLCVVRHSPPRGYAFYHVGPITGRGNFTRYRNIDDVMYAIGHDVGDDWQPA